jgi:hypothetical protein
LKTDSGSFSEFLKKTKNRWYVSNPFKSKNIKYLKIESLIFYQLSFFEAMKQPGILKRKPNPFISASQRGFHFPIAIIVLALFIVSFRWPVAGERDFGAQLKMDNLILKDVFSHKKGDSLPVYFTTSENKDIEMRAVVATHINQGATSGVMRLDLAYGDLKFKLLLSRKELNGKMQYQINLIQQGGSIHYRFAKADKNEVVLEKTSLSKIITE